MEDPETTGMGKALLLFCVACMPFVIVTGLSLIITADMNSYPETEDDPQSVMVISIVGEKPFLHLPSDMHMFILIIFIRQPVFF